MNIYSTAFQTILEGCHSFVHHRQSYPTQSHFLPAKSPTDCLLGKTKETVFVSIVHFVFIVFFPPPYISALLGNQPYSIRVSQAKPDRVRQLKAGFLENHMSLHDRLYWRLHSTLYSEDLFEDMKIDIIAWISQSNAQG